MQVPDFPVLRTAICVIASVLAVGCSGIPSGMVQSNLVAESVQVVIAEPVQETSFQVKFTFRNTGVTTNDLGFNIRLEIFDGVGSLVETRDQRFASSLAEDASAQVIWTISEGLAAGFYTATATLDINEEVTESSTSDNSNFRDFEVIPLEGG